MRENERVNFSNKVREVSVEIRGEMLIEDHLEIDVTLSRVQSSVSAAALMIPNGALKGCFVGRQVT